MSRENGAITDLVTQQWVKLSGRRVTPEAVPWLDGPTGDPGGIGSDFFDRWARRRGLEIDRSTTPRGLLTDIDQLAGPSFDPTILHPDFRRFYEQTSDFEVEAWSEWCGAFRPFGWILAKVFSRRLQQLNVPLRPLDTSKGTQSEVVHLVDPKTKLAVMSAWVRHLHGSGDVLYAGGYSVAEIPGHANPCVRVVFPLPNGNAIVLLRPSAEEGGALTVLSSGQGYGEPGFYFTVRRSNGRMWVRYVRAMRESIRVYASGEGEVRADHVMWYFGRVFLRLHYRLRPMSRDRAVSGEA